MIETFFVWLLGSNLAQVLGAFILTVIIISVCALAGYYCFYQTFSRSKKP